MTVRLHLQKDKLRASVCHRCVGVALARAFCLKKDSMRHAQKDLQAYVHTHTHTHARTPHSARMHTHAQRGSLDVYGNHHQFRSFPAQTAEAGAGVVPPDNA
jgi:hypothetical protein